MLAIRLQRTGRHGHAQFRLVVQDSRFSPKSGRVVAHLGSYNPHTKAASIKTDEVSSYLANGAQPSDRVVKLLQKEGVKLPGWVKTADPKKRSIRHPEKLRRNRPPEEKVEAPAPEATAEETSEQAPAEKQPEESAESTAETAAENSEGGEPTETEATEAPETDSKAEESATSEDKAPGADKSA